MKNDRFRALLLIVAIFLCGALAGAAVQRLQTANLLRDVLGGPPEGLEARVKLLMLDRGLELSAEQQASIRPVLERSARAVRAARARIEPEVAPIRREERDAIRALLNAEQRREYDRRLEEIDAALGRSD